MNNHPGTFAGYTPGGLHRAPIKRAIATQLKKEAEQRRTKKNAKSRNLPVSKSPRLIAAMKVVDTLLIEKVSHGIFTLTDAEIATATGLTARASRSARQLLSDSGIIQVKKSSCGLGMNTVTLWWVDKQFIKWNRYWVRINSGIPHSKEYRELAEQLWMQVEAGDLTEEACKAQLHEFWVEEIAQENQASLDRAIRRSTK